MLRQGCLGLGASGHPRSGEPHTCWSPPVNWILGDMLLAGSSPGWGLSGLGWGPRGSCPPLPSTGAAFLSAPLKRISLRAGLTLAKINRAKLGPLLAAHCRVPPPAALPPRPAGAESREIYPKGGLPFSFWQQTMLTGEWGPPLWHPQTVCWAAPKPCRRPGPAPKHGDASAGLK